MVCLTSQKLKFFLTKIEYKSQPKKKVKIDNLRHAQRNYITQKKEKFLQNHHKALAFQFQSNFSNVAKWIHRELYQLTKLIEINDRRHDDGKQSCVYMYILSKINFVYVKKVKRNSGTNFSSLLHNNQHPDNCSWVSERLERRLFELLQKSSFYDDQLNMKFYFFHSHFEEINKKVWLMFTRSVNMTHAMTMEKSKKLLICSLLH